MNKIIGIGILFILFINNPLWAQNDSQRYFIESKAPACPTPFEFKQKDGRTLTVTMRGDGYVHHDYTSDGYTVVFNQSQYEYATKDSNNNLIPSGIVASNPEQRTKKEISYLKSLPKSINYSKDQISERKKTTGEKTMSIGNTAAFPSKGKNKMLIILIQFPDLKAKFSADIFKNLASQENYNGTGSIRDYYLKNSFGQLDLDIDVFGWYTAQNSFSYYGRNDINGNERYARLLAEEAIYAAEKAGIDFSQYDNNKDGKVDGVQVIHAGGGEESGAGANSIWSHSSYISNEYLDKVEISAYTMNPETNHKTNTITSIGVLCHEFGHNLGLPDFYDTDYSSIGLGQWDMMAGGSWLNEGITPSNHNSWSKMYLGWLTPETLTNSGKYTLNNPATENKAYIIPTTNAKEYFILENKQRQNFDKFINSNGLIIFHVDENIIRQNIITNSVNDNETHPGIRVIPADNIFNSSTFSDDTYPSKTGLNLFTDYSIPAITMWSGSNSTNKITNITNDSINGIVTFNYNIYKTNIPTAYFSVNKATAMINENISTINLSQNNPTSYKWIMQDASISSSISETPDNFSYLSPGLKAITLIASNENGTDSLTRYIDITEDYPMLDNKTFKLCSGNFYDSGLNKSSYSTNENYITTLLPESDTNVLELTFKVFAMENSADCSQDYLLIYDGIDTTAKLIGKYCGTNKPISIKASNPKGALTFHFISNENVTLAGWQASIACSKPSPTNNLEDIIATTENTVFKLYPNPADDNITVSCQNNNFLIELYDYNGNCILKKQANDYISTLNLSNLSKGLYLIKITDNQTVSTQKLIKQ